MRVEAVAKSLWVNLPQDGGDVLLRPGVPADLPPMIVWKLLRQAKGRVRLAISPTADWLTLWQFDAEVSNGLEPTDPRLTPVLAAIQHCDTAFTQGDKAAFLIAVEGVVKAMEAKGYESSSLF
jgi:hypothetical protein